ncbi:MAG TPA: SPOR domain-containing protein [Gemmatimonadaceae bacterium]|nr:SPOR domain-containing protein [Gemmatimonadaceae bacterium]
MVRPLVALLALVVAVPVGAQTAHVAEDSAAIARARRLVSGGEGAAGRLVIDSMLARTPVSALWYAEGLYWRAALATNALDAERDYRRVAVEYPLSPRVHDALTRLAQLELARGDRGLARRHLERLLRETPPAAARASAFYWLARIDIEEGKRRSGCELVDSARAIAPAGDVELQNQLDAETRRCRSAPLSDAVLPAAGAATPDAPAGTSRRPASGTVTSAATRAAAHTVQVGAYPQRASADRLRAQLAAKGFPARVVPAGTMWRVRVGRYAVRRDAERMAARLRGAKYPAWIVEAEAGR